MKSFGSFLLVTIFSLALIVGLFTFDLKSVFLNPNTIKKALSENNAYEEFVNKALPTLVIQGIGDSQTQSADTEKLLTDLGHKLIDPAALRIDVESVIDSVLPYINGKTSYIDLKISLEKYRKSLSDNLEPALVSYFNSLPVCKIETQTQDTEGIPSCRPSNVTPQQLYRQVPAQELQQNLLDTFPTQLQVTEEKISFVPNPNAVVTNNQNKTSPELKTTNLSKVRQYVQRLNQAILISFGIAILALIILFVVWGKNYRSALRWLSGTLFTNAILPLILSLVVLFVFHKDMIIGIVSRISGDGGTNFAKSFDFAAKVINSLFQAFAKLLLWQTLAMIVISIGITLFLAIYHHSSQKATEKTT